MMGERREERGERREERGERREEGGERREGRCGGPEFVERKKLAPW